MRSWKLREEKHLPKVTHGESTRPGFKQALWGQSPPYELPHWTAVRMEGPCPVRPCLTHHQVQGESPGRGQNNATPPVWSCLSSWNVLLLSWVLIMQQALPDLLPRCCPHGD